MFVTVSSQRAEDAVIAPNSKQELPGPLPAPERPQAPRPRRASELQRPHPALLEERPAMPPRLHAGPPKQRAESLDHARATLTGVQLAPVFAHWDEHVRGVALPVTSLQNHAVQPMAADSYVAECRGEVMQQAVQLRRPPMPSRNILLGLPRPAPENPQALSRAIPVHLVGQRNAAVADAVPFCLAGLWECCHELWCEDADPAQSRTSSQGLRDIAFSEDPSFSFGTREQHLEFVRCPHSPQIGKAGGVVEPALIMDQRSAWFSRGAGWIVPVVAAQHGNATLWPSEAVSQEISVDDPLNCGPVLDYVCS